MTTSRVRIGLLGCGTVGAALVELLRAERRDIAARSGVELEIVRVAVRDVTRDRGLELAPGVLTDDPAAVVAAADVDLVVEVIGGLDPAKSLVLAALGGGKPVVTGNKELLAHAGAELFAAADAAGVDLLFEAAVAGGIPFVRPLRESLLGEPIERVMGIVNGTTNYILTRMTDDGASYADALAEAQRLGYAEADPTADVEGHDARAKAAIIASIAFGVDVAADAVHCEGISRLTADDIAGATRRGYVIKLLAVAERADRSEGTQAGAVAVRVHPALVPEHHPLASVRGSFNAVFVQGRAVGDLMFYGRGAGGMPTASAVLGDVIDAARNLVQGSNAPLGTLAPATVVPIDELVSEYSIVLDVADRPGVLATIAGAFARHEVSIRSMEQEGLGDEARLVFITHEARERSVAATLAELRELDVVTGVGNVLRLVADEAP